MAPSKLATQFPDLWPKGSKPQQSPGSPDECAPGYIRNPKTKRCIQDTAANRKRLGLDPAPCPSTSPLRNPATGRCLKDTPANRRKVGLTPAPAPPARTRRRTRAKEPAPRRLYPWEDEGDPPAPRPDGDGEKWLRELDEWFRVNKYPPVLRAMFANVEQYKKPVTKKKAENTGLASHLYKLVYGDAASKYDLDFLDKTSLVSNDSAKWRGNSTQAAVGLIYLLVRHRDNSCSMLTDSYISMFGLHAIEWNVRLIPPWQKPEDFSDDDRVVHHKLHKAPITYTLDTMTLNNLQVSLMHPHFDFKAAYEKCQANGKRFMIGEIGIEINYPAGFFGKGGRSGHANAIIYDLEKQELEIFEPQGGSGIANYEDMMRKEMYKAIHTLFKKHYPVKKFHSPLDRCHGPQYADALPPAMVNAFMIKNKPYGYCAAWSLYYLDLRLSNPDVPRKELINGFMGRFWHNSLSFITAYSNFILNHYDEIKQMPEWKKLSDRRGRIVLQERLKQAMNNENMPGDTKKPTPAKKPAPATPTPKATPRRPTRPSRKNVELPTFFENIEEFKKPIPKKTGLATYLYKMAFGDTASKRELDFLDKMSLVNNDSAKWDPNFIHTSVGLLYIFLRHRQVSCSTKSDITVLSNHTYNWVSQEVSKDYKLYTGKEDRFSPVYQRIIKDENRYTLVSLSASPDVDLGVAYKRCKANGKRFMIGMIDIGLGHGHGHGHANSLIYDVERQELEIFEPHGSLYIEDTESMRRTEMYKAVHADFKKHIPVTKFYPPMDYCLVGPQLADSSDASIANARMIKDKPGGYCAAWSLYYLDLRMSNPDIPRKDLIQKFMRSGFRERSLSFINAYSKFIVDLYDNTLDTPAYKRASEKQQLAAIQRRLKEITVG
jgi:hypothetical protein